MAVRVRTVALPMWGTIVAFGSEASGWSAPIGSRSNTSRPAAHGRPSLSASTSSASLTTGPRDALTNTAVGFISANSAAPNSPRVSSESGSMQTTKSASRSRASSGR